MGPAQKMSLPASLTESTKSVALSWFKRYHYTGTCGGTRFFSWGTPEQQLAMVAVGKGGNRYGVADKFGLLRWKGGLEITRVACGPDAPRNTASKAVSEVLRVLAGEGHQWVFTYADTAQGHHGGIYQALNAVYVGTDAKQWVNFELDGKRISKRAVSGRFGHTRWPEVSEIAAKAGCVLKRVPWMPKLTYIIPIATDRRDRRAILRTLASVGLPYVKKGEPVTPTKYRNHRLKP